jgi:aminoglycoside phosphotransferase (APT) family kinase protein
MFDVKYQEFNDAWLGEYLTGKLGRPIEVTDLEKFTRGTSRQTWFASYRPKGESDITEIVLRTDHPAGSGDPTPLDQEYFIYSCLGKTDLPVAAALWWEDDPEVAPRPFYIRQKIEGSWNLPGYADPDPKYDEVRLEASKEHIRKLAAIHNVDWKDCGFDKQLPAPSSLEDAAPCFVRTLMDRVDWNGAEPLPILLELEEWLLDRAPVAPRVSLCKGTNGLGEEVFRDGKIVALSDWEEVMIGDPASDLAMVQGFTETITHNGETLWNLEKALEFYRQESGIDVSMENVQFYQIARLFGRLVMFAHTADVVAGNPGAHPRQAWTVTEVLHSVKQALGAVMGWFEPVPSSLWEELNESVEMLEEQK